MPRLSTEDQPIGAGAAYSFIKDCHKFTTEGATLRVMYTPGHTDDHICLVLEEENILFSGDCVLGEGSSVFEDLYTYMRSLDMILSHNALVIYPGHGPIVCDPRSHVTAYIGNRNKREGQIIEALTASHSACTAMDLVHVIYTDTPEHLHRSAASNVTLHLRKLLKEQRVECNEEKEGTKWKIVSEKSSKY